jgi:DHA2 family multidrug resistance protein
MPVSTAGLLLMPRGVGSFFALFFINRAMDRLGIRTIISMGTFMAILSMELMRHFTLEISYTQIIASGLLQGLGISMVMLPSSILLFQSLDPLMRADGSVLSILARNLPASFGISIFFAYLSRNIQSFHAVLTEAVTPYEHWVNFPELWNWEETSGALLLNHEITRQASMQAYIADFALMEWLFLASIPLVFLLGSAPNHSPAGNAVPATH